MKAQDEQKDQKQHELEERRRKHSSGRFLKIALAILLLIVIGGISYSPLKTVFERMHVYNNAQKAMQSGQYWEACELYDSLGDYKDARALCLEAYRANLELIPSAKDRITGYQWLLGNGYPKEKIFDSFIRMLASITAENDRIAGWRWMNDIGYEKAKAELFEIAVAMVNNGHYKKGYELFIELGDYQDAQEKALALTGKITLDAQGGMLSKNLDTFTVVIDDMYPALPAPTRDGYTFNGWWTEKNASGQRIESSSVVTTIDPIKLYASWKLIGIVKVGDIGFGGGYVFYDKGSYSDGWRYLEAAPAGWSGVPFNPNYGFGCYRNSSGGANMVVGTKTEIGTGEKNTADLVSAMGDIAFVQESGGVKTLYAAKVCADYSGGGHDDWFLPSRDELNLMYHNLKEQGLGDFTSAFYWSSSEYHGDFALNQYFGKGIQDFYLRSMAYKIRPVRAF